MARESARSSIAKIASVATAGVVTLSDAARALGLSTADTSRRMSALVRRGWVTRVRRTVFSVRPLESAPNVPISAEDPWALAMVTFAPCYIGGWSAANHWGLTEQLFRTTLVVTRRAFRGSDIEIGGSTFRVVRDARLSFDRLNTEWRGGNRVLVSGIARTLLDGCAHPDWVGGGRSLIEIFRAAQADAMVTRAELLSEARHAGSGAALGRLGLLAERFFPNSDALVRFARQHRGTGYVRFDPKRSATGALVTRWGVWLNVDVEGAEP